MDDATTPAHIDSSLYPASQRDLNTQRNQDGKSRIGKNSTDEGMVDEGVNSYRRAYGESVMSDNGCVPGGGDAMKKEEEEEIEDGCVEWEDEDGVATREETIEGKLSLSQDGIIDVSTTSNVQKKVIE